MLALAFVFNAAGLQHGVILQREMRFTALATITTISQLIGTFVAILRRHARLWILGVGSHGSHASCNDYDRLLGRHKVVSGNATTWCGNAFDDAIRWHDHREYPHPVRRK